MSLRYLTIRDKLNFGLGLLIAILCSLAVYLLVSIGTYEDFVEEIQDATDYNQIVEQVQLNNLRKADFLKRYIETENPALLQEINNMSDAINSDLERLRVLGENRLILNSLNDASESFDQRSELVDNLILMVRQNDTSNDEFEQKLSQVDSLSSDLVNQLNRINEVSRVEKLQQSEMLDENFYLNRLTSTGLIIIVSLFLIVVSYVLTNSISTPLKRMNVAAERIAEGDFDFDIKVNSNDEIGVLMKTFNTMKTKLDEAYKGLEDKVEERTKELNSTIEELNGTKESLLGTMEVLNEKQQSIEKQKARFEAILFNLGEGLVFMDLEQRVQFGNKAVTDLLGFTPGEYEGEKWYEVVKPTFENGDEISEEELSFNIILNDKSIDKKSVSLSDGHFYRKKNGERLPVSVVTSKVVYDEKTIGIILVFKDVTKEKEVDKAKTEFVSLASHQLRTPLTSISWNTEMLINGEVGELDEEQRVYLEEVYYGSKRLINLVNSLLNTSRIDLGNFIIEPEDVNVKEFTEEIVSELDQKFEEREMNFEADYDDIGVKPLDKKLYHILIENLLTNSIKYTPEGGKIKLSLKNDPEGMKLQVSDNGYGIPEDQKVKIFSKLFRADNVKAKDTDGTGLGLYLVKSIVDYVGGKIWFESQEDMGTTFTIILPNEGMKPKEGHKVLNTK